MSTVISENSESTKLNSLQISLLRLFEQKLDQSDTLEVHKMLMDYFDHKLQAELEEVTARKGYTEDDYRKMLSDDTYATE